MFYRRDAETQKVKSFKGIAQRRSFASKICKGFLGVPASRRLIVLIVLAASGCGVPNLETPACVESRDIVREFYSYHFGNGLTFSADSLKQRERFLTPGLVGQFSKVVDGADPFTTGTTDFPKAFRVGECKQVIDGETAFQVLLFWRDDNSSRQKTIIVETVKTGDKWLINRIYYYE